MEHKRLATLRDGDALPERIHVCDSVQLFLYNAALWNANRIHFDHPYATGVEGYAGLVIAGPLIGDWLSQCVTNWLGTDGRLVSLEYSNRRAAYVDEPLTAGGVVREIDRQSRRVRLELFVRNEAGEIVAPGTALVELAAG